MNKLSKNQKGFTAFEVTVVILIVVLIGVVGWLVYRNYHKNSPAYSTALIKPATTTKPTTPTPPVNPYASWKSYALTYEKLTLMYPANWTVADQSSATAKHDEVTLSSTDGFSFSINDGIQNGGDPLPLVSSDPVAVKYLGNPAYLVFVNPKVAQAYGPPVPDTSVVGGAILLTDANNQASFPADKNVIGSSQYNGVNGPEGSYTFITMGYNVKNNMPITNAKTDTEYKNGELVIQSMHY